MPRPPRLGDLDSDAVFLNTETDLTDKLELAVGVRRSHDRKDIRPGALQPRGRTGACGLGRLERRHEPTIPARTRW